MAMTSSVSDRSAVSRADRIPGEPGVWVLLICEMTVFTALFAVIAFNASHNRAIFASAQQVLNPPLGLINTCVLIGGSVLVMRAIAHVQAGRYTKAARLMTAAMTCGATFAVIKGIEYASVLHQGMWIHTNVFWLLFFVVTGAHLLHVLVGVTVLGLARRAAGNGLPGSRDRDLFLSAACYWHLVDLLWLVLFPLFYLVN
jgi:nitric oxide reductase NorE protein